MSRRNPHRTKIVPSGNKLRGEHIKTPSAMLRLINVIEKNVPKVVRTPTQNYRRSLQRSAKILARGTVFWDSSKFGTYVRGMK